MTLLLDSAECFGESDAFALGLVRPATPDGIGELLVGGVGLEGGGEGIADPGAFLFAAAPASIAARNAPEMIAPMSPAELAPGDVLDNGVVVGTATDACMTGAVVEAVDPGGATAVVVGAEVWVMVGLAGWGRWRRLWSAHRGGTPRPTIRGARATRPP